MSKRSIICWMAIVLFMSPAIVRATTIVNVNSGGKALIKNSYDSTPSMSATRAAPLEYVGNVWNCMVPDGKAANLKDSIGTDTGVSVTTLLGSGPSDWHAIGDAVLMQTCCWGAFKNNGAGWMDVLKFEGLNPAHSYSLAIASGHNDSEGCSFQVAGKTDVLTCTVQNKYQSTNWIASLNYVLLNNLVAADGTLTVQCRPRDKDLRGAVIVNAFQLVDNTAPTPKSPDKDMLTFLFPSLGHAEISGTNVNLNVLYGTAVKSLAPVYTMPALAAGSPASGSVGDFTHPKTYTITAQDGSTKAYRVSVTILPASPANEVRACTFGTLGPAFVSGTTVTLTVPAGQTLKGLVPTFKLSDFANISPASGSAQNFTVPVTYTVTAQNGTTKSYRVEVLTYAAWKYSASLVLLTTPEGADLPASAQVVDFPVLVRLNKNNFDFTQAKPDGADIRFSTSAGLPMPYQIEEWNASGGSASVWVLVPQIAGHARQEIKMYWGKSDGASESRASSVFKDANGFVTVMHMNETLTDELGTIKPVDVGTTLSAGMIGKSRHMNVGQGVNCGDNIAGYPRGTNAFTSECWFRAEQGGAGIICWGRYATRLNGNSGDGNLVDLAFGAPAKLSWSSDGGGYAAAATVPALKQWYHVAATYEDRMSKIFVDGKLEGSNKGGLMSMYTNIYMRIGGSPGGLTFAGDIDEVRVSSVARSADWMRLAYENQKAFQTLVGPPIQKGADFSVSPSSVKMKEGAVVKLTAKAGGAQKLYWVRMDGSRETLLAVDQFTFDYAAGRVVGDQSFVIRLNAVYPNEVKTKDIPVQVQETLSDPVFTLKPSTKKWDGRTAMNVVPDISNWRALQDKGVTNLNYAWSVEGIAVSKEITPGTLKLLRAQGSGPMNVTLVLDNGGAPITNATLITVQEPKNEAWVVRTPGKDEKPVENQFYARDDKNEGTLVYNGTLNQAADSVFLKLYADDKLIKTETQKPAADKSYAFTMKLRPGLIKYKVEFGTKTGTAETMIQTVTNLVCGDAYIIDGQSNAVADDGTVKYSSEWIRCFGTMGGGSSGGWGNAKASGGDHRIGAWGVLLSSNLVARHKMPICMINDAVGGTMVCQHLANPTNHFDTTGGPYSNPYNIYGNLLSRVTEAKLTHGIRGVLWHQGEADQGSGAPTGDYNYKSYQQFFVDISMDWKKDMPNIQHYYIFQVWPSGGNIMSASSDLVREAQRTLPRLYSNMEVMSTVGCPGFDVGAWHPYPTSAIEAWRPSTVIGYAALAALITPLVERDNYGVLAEVTAPDLKKARFTSASHDKIEMVFGQPVIWGDSVKGNLYLDRTAGKIVSGKAEGNTIILQLDGVSTNKTIDYVLSQHFDGNKTNLIYGANGIAALTFAGVPIE